MASIVVLFLHCIFRHLLCIVYLPTQRISQQLKSERHRENGKNSKFFKYTT